MTRHIELLFDKKYIEKLPKARKGLKMHPNRGIRINCLWYWNDIFEDKEIKGKSLQVRYDPFDVEIVYAKVKGKWVSCTVRDYAFVAGWRVEKVNLHVRMKQQPIPSEIRKVIDLIESKNL